MISRTKIEWCDYVWNPTWGCENNCLYCYARKIAKRFYQKIAFQNIQLFKKRKNRIKDYARFKNDLKDFKPTWLESNFVKSFPEKPSRIFVNSMSDIAFWEDEWIDKVLSKITDYPQHTFIFLTKNPECYFRHQHLMPENCWLGATAVNMDMLKKAYRVNLGIENKYIINLEPLQQYIDGRYLLSADWIILGAETGNRKGKVTPKRSWLTDIVNYCKQNNIPIFMKDNLASVWGTTNCFYQEWPE